MNNLFCNEMIIATVITGSKAYGMATPQSDTDIRGIFVASPISIRTPFFRIGEQTINSEEDTKYYELNKFIQLAIDCNPNILDLLWVEDSDIIFRTDQYDLLRSYREQMLTSKIAMTTSGYAISQLKRIKGHHKWLNKPQQKEEPFRKSFMSVVYNFTSNTKLNKDVPFERLYAMLVSSDTYSLYDIPNRLENRSWVDNAGNPIVYTKQELLDKKVNVDRPIMIVKFNNTLYHDAHDNWQHYWEWKNNRNKIRSELEEKFSYDSKHAMHLVRLLKTGVEALTDGVINVKRHDAAELLSIRNGAWTYEQLIEYADEMDVKIKQLQQTTHLPKHVDLKAMAKLVMDIQDLTWGS